MKSHINIIKNDSIKQKCIHTGALHTLFSTVFLIVSLFSNSIHAAPASGSRVLDDIDISTTNTESVIQLTLLFPVNVITYTLSRSDTLLQVKVQFPMVPDDSLDAINQRESIGVTPSKVLPLNDVTFDGTRPDIKVINFTFSRAVKASAEQGTDFRSIVVKVKLPEQAATAAPKKKVSTELSSEDKALLDKFQIDRS